MIYSVLINFEAPDLDTAENQAYQLKFILLDSFGPNFSVSEVAEVPLVQIEDK